MRDRTEAQDSTEPTPRKLPTEATDTAEPIEPTDRTDPTDPMESTEPVELMQRNERDEPMDQRELAAVSVPPVPMPPSMARPTGSGPCR